MVARAPQARPVGEAVERVPLWIGALLALVVAVALFSQFSIDDRLSRDESIYLYGGQQLAEGVPPYVSIVDPKTPLATLIAGGAVTIGRALGTDDVIAARIAFFLVSCLSVVAVYLAAAFLFRSVEAGLVGAAAFASFRAFAMDGLGGPNPKTPGVLLATLATALLVRRRWFWSGVVGSLAALAWQPLAIYVLVAVGAAFVDSEAGRRARAVATVLVGAAIPAVVTVAGFIAVRAWSELLESALALPLTGTQRREATLPERISHIGAVVDRDFGASGLLLWGGLLAIVVLVALRIRDRWGERQALARDPLAIVVSVPLLFIVAFSLVDFQGYDDVYPLLPYAALGIAGLAAAALAGRLLAPHRVRLALAGVGLGLVVASFISYSLPRPESAVLVAQRRDAVTVDELLGDTGRLYVLGNPTLLVLTDRVNPSRYVFLSGGVDQWVVDHTPGGFDGWLSRIRKAGADVIQIDAWITQNEYRDRIRRQLLRSGYEPIQIGLLELLVTPELRDRAAGRPVGELLR